MTVEVVILMTYALSAKSGKIALEPVSVSVLSLEVNIHRTCNISPDIRAGKAAFLNALTAVSLRNFGVYTLKTALFEVHDEETSAKSDLRCSETESRCLGKGFVHIV